MVFLGVPGRFEFGQSGKEVRELEPLRQRAPSLGFGSVHWAWKFSIKWASGFCSEP